MGRNWPFLAGNIVPVMVSNMRPLPTPLSCVWPYLGQFWEKNQVDSVLETGESRTRAYSIEVYPRPIPLVSAGLRLKPQARRLFFW